MNNCFKFLLLFIPLTVNAEVTEPSSLKIDVGQAKVNFLLQTWYLYDSTTTTLGKNNFRARRAEVKFSGTLNPETRWFVMIDPAKSLKAGAIVTTNDNKILQDLGIAYQPIAGLEFTVGQFKIPTTAEGLDSSADLPLPERSLIGRTLGDKRQLGFQTAYKAEKWKIMAMYSNGGNSNADDTTNAKDINLRAELMPIAGLNFGIWSGATDFKFGENMKWGSGLRWKGEKEMARVEYAHSDETTAGVKAKVEGYVAEIGYSVLSNLQPVIRYERYYPDAMKTAASKIGTVGVNYYFSKNNHKLQAAYSAMGYAKGSNGSYTSDLTTSSGKMFILSFQMAI